MTGYCVVSIQAVHLVKRQKYRNGMRGIEI